MLVFDKSAFRRETRLFTKSLCSCLILFKQFLETFAIILELDEVEELYLMPSCRWVSYQVAEVGQKQPSSLSTFFVLKITQDEPFERRQTKIALRAGGTVEWIQLELFTKFEVWTWLAAVERIHNQNVNSEEEAIRSNKEATHLVQAITVYQKCNQVDSTPQSFHVINNSIHCCLKGKKKEAQDYVSQWQLKVNSFKVL